MPISDSPTTKSLGRGLSSLIGQNANYVQRNLPIESVPYLPKTNKGVGDQILHLAIDEIKSNPYQPRKDFDQIKINDLVASIKEHGILQPLIVSQTMAGEYELIAGERRLRAAKLAGLTKVPVIVRTTKEMEKLELSLIENVQRQDLNPMEKAESYKKLVDEFNITHEEAAKKLGISRTHFTNMIRVLGLPPDIQKELASGKISLGHAKALLELKDKDKQEQIFKRAVQGGLTVEDVRKQVKKVKIGGEVHQIKKDPYIKEWEQKMQEKLNTKVSIRKRGQWGGMIEVEFYSDEELMELVKKIVI